MTGMGRKRTGGFRHPKPFTVADIQPGGIDIPADIVVPLSWSDIRS
jgi:hypothetical protein